MAPNRSSGLRLDHDLDRLTSLIQSGQAGGSAVNAKQVTFAYNGLGQKTNVTRYQITTVANLVASTDYSYDTGNRLSGITHKQGVTTLNSYTMGYDLLSRITSITSTADGASTYTYDVNSQLKTTTNTGGLHYQDEAFSYDANGNRNGANYTVGSDNRTTTTPGYVSIGSSILANFNYTYDDEGNVISKVNASTGAGQAFQWDHRNRLIKVTSIGGSSPGQTISEYQYDAFDRLLGEFGISWGNRWYYDDGINPTLHNEWDFYGSQWHRYLWSNEVDELLADEQFTSFTSLGNTLWALSDHQGSIRDIADMNESTGVTSVDNHRRYDAFGRFVSQSGSSEIDFGYTGKYLDKATGFQNNLHRWYDPNLGKWLSQDPIGFSGRDANLYRYVGNSPTNATDPSGLFGVGHHWITMSKLHGVADKFEKDALFVLIGAYSGLLENAHNRRRMDGISHSEYDKAIEQSLRDFLDARQVKGKVTPEEAKQLAQDVYEGRVFNKVNAASLKKFNAQVVKELRDKEGFLEPRNTPTETLIKQGKSYAQTDRGKQIMRAAKFLGLLGGILSAAQVVEMAEASTSPLSGVFRSIAAGDYAGAERGLIGENAGSLISVLREKEQRFIYGEALFKEKVRTIIAELKDWDERFLNDR